MKVQGIAALAMMFAFFGVSTAESRVLRKGKGRGPRGPRPPPAVEDCENLPCGCPPRRDGTEEEKLAFKSCQCDGLWNRTSAVFISQEALCNFCVENLPDSPEDGLVGERLLFGRGGRRPGRHEDEDEDESDSEDDNDDDDERQRRPGPLGEFCGCCEAWSN